MRAQRSRRWTFTLNNFTPEWEEVLKNYSFDYILYGYEIAPTTGTPHLQGYFEISKKLTMLGIKKQIGIKQISLFLSKGTAKQNSNYCLGLTEGKQPNEFYEFGTPIAPKGQRNDLVKLYSRVKEGATDLEIQDEFPGQYIRYYRGIEKMRKNYEASELTKKLLGGYENYVLRRWQARIIKRLEQQDDRKILWVWEEDGNVGKSNLADYLDVVKGAFLITNGKNSDISYAYDGQEIVVFDYARTQCDYINYQVIEDLKNGRIFSSKYESKMKRFLKPKIICFANYPPQTSTMSSDRWDIVNIRDLEWLSQCI